MDAPRINHERDTMKTNLTRSLTMYAVAAMCLGPLGACDEEMAQDLATTLAEASEKSAITPEALGLDDGWVEDRPGLWTLVDDHGEQKFLGIGDDGRAHAIRSLEAVEAELEQDIAQQDNDVKLDELRGFIAAVSEAPASDLDEGPMLRCSFDVSALVDAKPIACGASATATATFAHPCGTTQGTVQTYAKASCGYITNTQACGPKTADPATCASTTSITGPGPCSSYGFAKITGPGVYLYIWDQNDLRGACGGGSGTSGLPYPNQCPGVNVECYEH